MPGLDILRSNPINLKNKITKNFVNGPSKILKNISWTINICLKYFMITIKTFQTRPAPPPPTYLMYGPLARVNNFDIKQKKMEYMFYYMPPTLNKIREDKD